MRLGSIRSVLPWSHTPTDTKLGTTFEIDPVDGAIPLQVTDHDLLLSDDQDPPALPHAAYSAMTHLWLWRPAPLPGRDLAGARSRLRARADHHTIPEIRHILDPLRTAADQQFPDALISAAAQLQSLTRNRHPS